MTRYPVCLLALLVFTACSQERPQSIANLTAPSPVSASVSVPVNYRAHLSGDQVVPALPFEILAQGEAILQLSPDGTELSFRVIASNIHNVTGVHIHLGVAGARGPLVAFLLRPVAAAGGRTDGVLATGTITAADLRGPLVGQPLSALINEFAAGNAYIDVPTNDGVAPVNTGPGDFFAGELRGQVR